MKWKMNVKKWMWVDDVVSVTNTDALRCKRECQHRIMVADGTRWSFKPNSFGSVFTCPHSERSEVHFALALNSGSQRCCMLHSTVNLTLANPNLPSFKTYSASSDPKLPSIPIRATIAGFGVMWCPWVSWWFVDGASERWGLVIMPENCTGLCASILWTSIYWVQILWFFEPAF